MSVIVLETPSERRPYAAAIWHLIVKTYRDYGNSEDGNLYGAQVEDLIETPGVWKLTTGSDEVIAGVIFRAFKGNKMRLVLHDNTRCGKDALKALFLSEFERGRCWGEVSGHLERILRGRGIKPISNTQAEAILGKPIQELDPNGENYVREVFPGTFKREVLFGKVEHS